MVVEKRIGTVITITFISVSAPIPLDSSFPWTHLQEWGDFSGGIMCEYTVSIMSVVYSIFCEQVVDIMKCSEEGTNCTQCCEFNEHPVVCMETQSNVICKISVYDLLCEMGAGQSVQKAPYLGRLSGHENDFQY